MHWQIVQTKDDEKLRKQLSKSLKALQIETWDGMEKSGELQSLKGKIEILMMENERLESSNKELTQRLSEMGEKKDSYKKTIETLRETSEDIFEKFNALREDLQHSKVPTDSAVSRSC